MNAVVEHSLPATEHRLNTYRCAQEQDPVCQQVIEHCRKGWPRKGLVKPNIAPYWKVRGSLMVCNRLLLYDHWIVVPKSLQEETKQKINGYQGIQRCRARVAAQTVQQCAECAKNSTPNKEPLIIVQLSMRRRIRMPIPQTNKLLVPNWAYLKTFREKNKQFKQSQKKRHRA